MDGAENHILYDFRKGKGYTGLAVEVFWAWHDLK